RATTARAAGARAARKPASAAGEHGCPSVRPEQRARATARCRHLGAAEACLKLRYTPGPVPDSDEIIGLPHKLHRPPAGLHIHAEVDLRSPDCRFPAVPGPDVGQVDLAGDEELPGLAVEGVDVAPVRVLPGIPYPPDAHPILIPLPFRWDGE